MKSSCNEALPQSDPQGSDSQMLDSLLTETFTYFVKEVNSKNGLIADKTQPGSPCSIAAVGLGLSTYVVAVKRGLLSRQESAEKVLTVLNFFKEGTQSRKPDAMGYKGFYYHFLDMQTGRRAWRCELSTIDTTFFIAGALTAADFFNEDSDQEKELRAVADYLYRRIDWVWALNGTANICHGWKPSSGFLKYYWDCDYSEAMLMYVLALGSPTFPIAPEGYKKWISTFKWKSIYGIEHLYSGPLFIHQLSHIWIDFKGIRDDFNRQHDIDYFENSRRATYMQREYAIENKHGFAHYGKNCWGFTASDGPGPSTRMIKGRRIKFYNYIARGAPFGPDDGTVSPWAVVASIPFAPEIVINTIRHAIERLNLKNHTWEGFDASFNPTYPDKSKNPNGWVSSWKFGLNQGPIILMIENYESGLLWNITKKIPYVISGLRKAGFRGGWLDDQ
ncbi:MAG: glucoamylase family protein [Chryseolinea sp.]